MEIPFINRMFDESSPTASVSRMASMLFTNWNPGHGGLDVVLLSEGENNALYRVEHKRHIAFDQMKHHEAILVKVWRGLDSVVDRSKVLKFHSLLSTSSIAPSPLLRFPNGHAYPFIHGQVCYSLSSLTPKMVWKAIAKEMAKWHTLLPVVDLEFVVERGKGYEGLSDVGPNIWTRARGWIEGLGERTEEERKMKVDLEREFLYLVDKLGAKDVTIEQLVLGHGNLVPRNIILQSRNERHSGEEKVEAVKFINYEHCIYCPQAFDLANHFSSWAGYECNYEQLPAQVIRRAFIQHYVSACRGNPRLKEGDEDPETEVSRLMDEVDNWRGFPGFYWGLYTLLQAADRGPDSESGKHYTEYATLRLAEYYAWKEETEGRREKDGKDMSQREKRWAAEDEDEQEIQQEKLENVELQCPNYDTPN